METVLQPLFSYPNADNPIISSASTCPPPPPTPEPRYLSSYTPRNPKSSWPSPRAQGSSEPPARTHPARQALGTADL